MVLGHRRVFGWLHPLLRLGVRHVVGIIVATLSGHWPGHRFQAGRRQGMAITRIDSLHIAIIWGPRLVSSSSWAMMLQRVGDAVQQMRCAARSNTSTWFNLTTEWVPRRRQLESILAKRQGHEPGNLAPNSPIYS